MLDSTSACSAALQNYGGGAGGDGSKKNTSGYNNEGLNKE